MIQGARQGEYQNIFIDRINNICYRYKQINIVYANNLFFGKGIL